MTQQEIDNKLAEIMMPYAQQRYKQAFERKTRFVHYTSAETAIKILQSGRMLLRNSVLMNDFSEVSHGAECLRLAYDGSVGARLKSLLVQIADDLPSIVESAYNAELNDVKNETYLFSISEHGDDRNESAGNDHEDAFGRLSMWRAYAPKNGVAFILNQQPFLSPTNALNASTSPVLYATAPMFEAELNKVADAIEQNLDFLKTVGRDGVYNWITHAFRFAILSTKHPSFKEEREWRVLYSPKILHNRSELTEQQLMRVPTEIMCLNGVPQRVFAIPFVNYPDEGFSGATVPELIDRVLIGPSVDSYAIQQAMIGQLNAIGVATPNVTVTGIPLRQP